MKIIKGETLEKQMNHVDRILKSYSIRLHKTVTGIITPFPISNYSETSADGVVLRYMFPAYGKVTIGGMFVEDMPKHGVNVVATIYRGQAVDSKTFFSKRQSIIINPDIKVSAGDRMLIKVETVSSEESVSGIWIAFLWTPEVKDSVVKELEINDLEKIGEEE